jgi:hypothetical protein
MKVMKILEKTKTKVKKVQMMEREIRRKSQKIQNQRVKVNQREKIKKRSLLQLRNLNVKINDLYGKL